MGAMVREISKIIVKRQPGGHAHQGILLAGNFVFPCLLGKGGIGTNKLEGDGKTPIGEFRLLHGLYRADRLRKPNCRLFMKAIEHNDGWCDAPDNANYNRPVELPFSGGHEVMWREDHLYDICLVMDYNIEPRVRHRGSAIFFHIASDEGKATQGCVALPLAVMRKLLPLLARNVVIQISN